MTPLALAQIPLELANPRSKVGNIMMHDLVLSDCHVAIPPQACQNCSRTFAAVATVTAHGDSTAEESGSSGRRDDL